MPRIILSDEELYSLNMAIIYAIGDGDRGDEDEGDEDELLEFLMKYFAVECGKRWGEYFIQTGKPPSPASH